ncbi:hypothetical protein MATL_G00045190 [Megalops atlanticus]|uniref:Uncharacterized protein n=1 Tax=Megalops atlanticus TaxID=7932 RepID=A0A9D3QDX8_MEGAT|nr:hypothetical protein MATL_G00045190 [Megalops atlanticus]
MRPKRSSIWPCNRKGRATPSTRASWWKVLTVPGEVGEVDQRMRGSSAYPQRLTALLVVLQETKNEISTAIASITPLRFTAPCMSCTQEQFNVINGIILFPLSQNDLKNMIVQRQRQELGKSEEQPDDGQIKLKAQRPLDD